MKVWSWRHAIQKTKMSKTTKLVLYNLSLYMNEIGQSCFPSISTQAEDCNLNVRSIYRSLNEAKALGFLEVESRIIGGRNHNIYYAKYPISLTGATITPENSSQPYGDNDTPENSSQPYDDNDTSGGCQSVTHTVAECHTINPRINPRINPGINTPPTPQGGSAGEISKSKKFKKKKFQQNSPKVEMIYAEYPRKAGCADAKKSIAKALNGGVEFEDLLEAVYTYANSRYVTTAPRQKIPHPATWFNQERWKDDRSEWDIPYEQKEKPVMNRHRMNYEIPGRK